MIRKQGKKYVLFSKDGKKKLGTFDSKKEAQDRETEINRIKHAKAALVDVEMVITKASLQDDGTMRWQAVASDTAIDRTGDRTSQVLFNDWIERATNGKSIEWLPGPRMPFLGISHYPDLDGFGEAGPTEKMYVDGDRFKANGTFSAGSPLGKALFEATRSEREMIQRGETVDQPIRISAAWWDISHSHGQFIFERKGIDDVCPMCANGQRDKQYLQGQLDHFAATRLPINPRTSLLLEEKSMTTKKEDAASIVGGELADELEQRTKKIVGKSETEQPEGLVVKADEPESDIEVQPEAEPAQEVDQNKADVEIAISHLPLGGATSMIEAQAFVEAQQQMNEVFSQWDLFSLTMMNIFEIADPSEMKGLVLNHISEFGDSVAAIKAAVVDAYLVENVGGQIMTTENVQKNEVQHPVDAMKAAIDGALANDQLDRTGKLTAIQDAFNGLAEIVKAQVDAVTPPDVSEQVAAGVEKGMAPIAEQLGLLVAKLGGQQTTPQLPQQKSFIPTGPVQRSETTDPNKPQSIRSLVRRSVGIVE